MIDPKSIKQIKYKNEDAVLACMLLGASVRASALSCGVSSKTAHKIRLKHADKFPEKEKRVKEVKQRKIAGVKRWVTIPPDVDAKIVKTAKENSRTWQDQANLIFEEWGKTGELDFDWSKTNFEIASDLSLERAEFCKNMKGCPECNTKQVQLIGWPDNPSWKCRHCKHKFNS